MSHNTWTPPLKRNSWIYWWLACVW